MALNITPKTWYEVSASRMDSAAPSPVPGGVIGVPAVMNAWSGGCFDTNRNRLIVWGGGHNDYAGNEIYAFSLSALSWSRIKDPVLSSREDSAGTFESTGYYPNGSGGIDPQQPRSRHTYNFMVYDSANDLMLNPGAPGYYAGGQTGTQILLRYNFSNNTWTSGTNVPPPIHYQLVTGFDSVSGAMWIYAGGSQGYLAKYVAATNTWTEYGDIFNGTSQIPSGSAYLTGEIDPEKRRLYAIGQGYCLYWSISGSGTINAVNVTTSGPQTLQNAQAPGIAYDPITKCIIGWAGGSTVYSLNTTTHVWSTITLDASNSVTPTNAESNGTFGRFRYSPTSNVFVGVNATDENVYLFKLNADQATSGSSASHLVGYGPIITLR